MFLARWVCLYFSISLAVLSGVLFIQRQQPAQSHYIVAAYGTITLQQLYRIRSDGQEVKVISPIQSVLPGWTQTQGRAWLYFISPDAVEDQMNLYRVSINSRAPEYLATLPEDVYNYGIHWSPDGSKIVYATAEEDGTAIYLVNLDNNQHKRLTDGQYPRWSPDGAWIAFVQSTVQGLMTPDGREFSVPSNNLYVIQPDETQPQLIQESTTFTPVYEWMQDSEHLVGGVEPPFTFAMGDLGIIDLEHKHMSQAGFIQPEMPFEYYGFRSQTFDGSPASVQVAVLHPYDRNLVVLTNIEGITEAQLFLPGPDLQMIDFSSDGKWLLVASDRNLYRINVQSGKAGKLYSVPRTSSITFASWMPPADLPFQYGVVLLGSLLLLSVYSVAQKMSRS